MALLWLAVLVTLICRSMTTDHGNPRAAADNLTCRVHDVDQLSCSWAVGKEAPANVQYYFYLETWPCPRYKQNQQGVNVQCHFDSISLIPQLQSQTLFRFLVNGTSGGSKIPCRETLHRLQDIEILAAPNITKTWCYENYSFMEWEVRSLFTEDLKYELEIQKGTDLPYKEETELKTFMLKNPGPYTVKVKAMDSVFFRRRPQGQWSAPQHLDCDRKDASFPLWLVYLLAPLGALLLVGLLFLCRRWPVMRKLFPRVPHVKDPIGDSFQNERMVAWDPEPESQEDCPVAQVQVLGET
ncbi:interleukin-3 receptor subunit alpha isoform X3 [Dama dama]|uniref:interleukin-3 receptor subunit alpha isoform X3 n=1 Tax=Dama dama TaxID=30532 RepID=UPI002A368221|nr:interleukin-3 receptor subunit alpha isoform X3 [Dama dama]